MTTFDWHVSTDPLRSEGKIHTTDLADSYVVVQEISVDEWGWMICADPPEMGMPVTVVAMRNGFTTAELAKAHVEKYVTDSQVA